MKEKRFTPRQRAAIAHPITDGRIGNLHPRHHRVNGKVQSILTFDMFESDDGGAVALWNARGTTFPVVPEERWTPRQARDIKRVVSRLVSGVGEGDWEARIGKDGATLHVFKRATVSEIAQALQNVAWGAN